VLLKCLIGILRLDNGNVKMSVNYHTESTSCDVINDGVMTDINLKIGFALWVCIYLLCITFKINRVIYTYFPAILMDQSLNNFEILKSLKIYQLLSLVGAIKRLSKDETIKRYKVMTTMIPELPKSDHLIDHLRFV